MQPIEAVDFYDIAKPSDPRLSPDGDWVAFVHSVPDDEEEYAATIHVVRVDGSDHRRFSLTEGVDAEPRWSPSGDRIAFTSTRGAADDRQQLWVLPVDGGEATPITDVVGGVSDVCWSPDGNRIAFVQSVTEEDREEGRDRAVPEEYEPADHPDPRVVDRTVYRSMENYFDGRRSHVYIVDVEAAEHGADSVGGGANSVEGEADSAEHGADSAEPVTRLTNGDADFGTPEWGDAGTLYYTEEVGEDPDDSLDIAIHAHDLATGAVDHVHTTTGWGTTLAATEDGRIAFTHTTPEQASIQPTDLHVLDHETGGVTDVTEPTDRTVGYETTPQWGPDAETLYFSTPDEGMTAVWQVPGDGSAAPERLVREGTIAGGHVGGPAGAGPDEVTVALAMSGWDHPGDVFVYDAATDGAERITELNTDLLDERDVGEPEELWIDSEGGRVQGWLLTPPGFDPDEEYPLAVEVHGGPHAMWSTAGTMWHEFQTLAARGYVVFWSNPRGSTGYGKEFMQAIERDWGAVTLADVMAGVRTVTERDYVDETNAFLTGGSFGGFMTSWAVGRTDYFRGAVAQRGVYDLTGFYGSTDGAYKLLEGDFDTVPSAEPEWLWEQSPTGCADQVDTPTLLIHSEDDTRTPICTAELYHRILRKNGVDTRMVRYPREGHELSRSGEPGHIVDRIERIARWFDGYSDHHDVPPALERGEDEGLTAAEDEDEDEDEDETGDEEAGGTRDNE